MKKIYAFTLLALVSSVSTLVLAQPGTLDPTFGTGGKVISSFGASSGAYSLAIQSDGKLVACGNYYSSSGTVNDFAVARYNTNGTLDNTFGSLGKTTTDFAGTDDFGNSVAIQSDGKIVVAGSSGTSTMANFAIARYLSNGALDNTFGTSGKVITNFTSYDDFATVLAIQPDGKIVVVGYTATGGSNWDFALARYNTNGTLDNTFGTSGKVVTHYGSDFACALSLQPDGKILVAGYTQVGVNYDFALFRYNSNGTLDNTFGTSGKVYTPIGTSDDESFGVVLQPDGKIVLSGYTKVGSNKNFALVRYDTIGALDNTFGTGGKVTTDFIGGVDISYSIALQPDAKIIAAGSTYNAVDNDFGLIRYNSNGTLDNTFGVSGKVVTDFASEEFSYSMALQTDGKIVLAGVSNANFALARYDIALATEINSATDQYSGIFVYPNPTNSIVTLSGIETESVIEVFNVLGGKVISVQNQSNSIDLDLSELENGIYFIKISSDTGTITKRIIKQ